LWETSISSAFSRLLLYLICMCLEGLAAEHQSRGSRGRACHAVDHDGCAGSW
jgi:hypothetical protein